jgi:hypothetical protein
MVRTRSKKRLVGSPPWFFKDSTPFWTDNLERTRVTNLAIHFLVETVLGNKNVCIVAKQVTEPDQYLRQRPGEFNFYWEQSLQLDPATGFQTVKTIGYPGRLLVHPELEHQLASCLNNKKKIILIPVSLYGYTFPDRDLHADENISGLDASVLRKIGHRVMVILNKYLKTVEFYDSNGSEAHRILYGDYDFLKIKAYLLARFPELGSYTFLKYEETCPRFAFQYYQAQIASDFDGFCHIWSIFNAHMRILYPTRPAQELQSEILEEMREREPTYLLNFIQRYALFLRELVNN